jgi:hypothetical protein
MSVAHAARVFDGDGRLADESLRANVANFLLRFSEFIGRTH